MKKVWKIAGAIAGVAALAALAPYSINKDAENDETTVYALLWKYTNKPDHENPGSRKVSVDIGFHNPLKEETDALLMDEDFDEPLLDTTPTVEEPTVEVPVVEPVSEPKINEGDCIPF